MKRMSGRNKLSTWSMGLLCVLALVGVAVAVQISGAIYTSMADGGTVNGNVYENKEDVYLNGGPQNLNAAGLPNGTYYFQVTDPSGATLLSTDNAECRQVQVIGGVISGATGPCPHADGDFNPANGSTPVQLIPFNDTPNAGGEYKVWLIAQTGDTSIDGTDPTVLHFVNSDTKTDNFKIRNDSQTPPVVIFGEKFYDTNTNGVHDGSEPVIAGWRIEKQPPSEADVTYTGTNGQYSFIVDPNSGLYTISEVPPVPGWYPTGQWLNTTATSGEVTVESSDVHGPDFGNVCLGPGGGLTLGFWSNKNGQRLFGGDDLALMVSLNLRNGAGAHFNPASYSQFRSWILSATATNMSYMLSAQLAAMELNVFNGKVDGGSLIYAPGTTSANGAGFATVSAVMAEANTELGLHGLVLDGSPYRSYQEALKNALDKANNNKTFVQSGPCAFDSPY